MKWLRLLLFTLLASARAQTPPLTVITLPPAASASLQATIQMGQSQPIVESVVAFPPRPPITVLAGSDIKFVAPSTGATTASVQWMKNGKILGATATTYEIPSATPADSGTYYCTTVDVNGTSLNSDNPTVFVLSHVGQRLLNYSVIGHIGSSQLSFSSGFVIEPGPASSPVLIRVAGPALATFGVGQPLAAPALQLIDAEGNVTAVPPDTSVTFYYNLPIAGVAAGVGAFPFPTVSNDIEGVFYLSPGAYTARVSAADGGSGAVLLEVYELSQ